MEERGVILHQNVSKPLLLLQNAPQVWVAKLVPVPRLITLRFRSARRSARLPKITVLSCSDDMFGNLRQNSGLNDCGDASQGQDDKQQQCPCTHTTTKPSSAHAHANTTLRGSMHFFQSKATQLQPQKHCALWLAAGLSQSLLRGEHSDWF